MKSVADEIKKFTGKRVLLLGHKNADPDAVCSIIVLSLGLKQIGINAVCGVVESTSKISQRILRELNEKVEINPDLNADLIVLLDTSTEGQLSDFAKKLSASRAKKIIIDHHSIHENTIKADIVHIDESATSAVRMVYALLNGLKAEITEKIAKAVLLGIIAETAHLQFAAITDFKLISELMEKFNLNYQWIISVLEEPLDISERIARLKAAQRAKVERINNFIVATSEISSFEASAARLLIRAGADVAAVASKKGSEVRISIRSTMNFYKKTKIDLGKEVIPEVASIIGGTGSGHPTAAGANGKLCNKADEALRHVARHLKARLSKK